MSSLEQRLTEMLEPTVESLSFELLGVEFVRAGKHSTLRLFIDHADGINVDHCAEVSRQVSAILDVEDPISTEYNLEVSSPGLDRPLFKLSHFDNVIGQDVTVKLNVPYEGRRNFKGPLVAVEEDGYVVVQVDAEQFALPIEMVAKANVVPKF